MEFKIASKDDLINLYRQKMEDDPSNIYLKENLAKRIDALEKKTRMFFVGIEKNEYICEMAACVSPDDEYTQNIQYVTDKDTFYLFSFFTKEGYRGKEIFDAESNAWYWLDDVDNGKKAVNKDVYQESEAGEWGDYVNADGILCGKWVRYDENGRMIKGWQTASNGTYTSTLKLSLRYSLINVLNKRFKSASLFHNRPNTLTQLSGEIFLIIGATILQKFDLQTFAALFPIISSIYSHISLISSSVIYS